MKKMKKRRRAKRANANKLLNPRLSRLIKIGAALLILALSLRTGFSIYDLKKQEKEALLQQEQLLLHEKELEHQMSVKDTPEYIEQQARNVLHMIKPGEILYIPDPDAKAKNNARISPGALNAKPSVDEQEEAAQSGGTPDDEQADDEADQADQN